MEEALEELWRNARIALPVLRVDLREVAPEISDVTSLSAPHRVADALLRDSMLEGTFFRLSAIGRSFTDSTARNASPIFRVCPTALVFGLWDSTGPKGGLGAKFERALVSEIVGVGSRLGVKTASRIDPTQIVTRAADVYEAAEPGEGWTHDPAAARKDPKGNPIKVKTGRVSEVNHSNIPPSIDDIAGGVTIDYACHTVVISIAALRKLYFDGHDTAARAVLAALGLLAVVAAQARGYDLRSRCLLVPQEGKALRFDAVRRDGNTQPLTVELESAIAVYRESVAQLPESLRFTTAPGEPLATLTPSPKLAYLIQKSRELAAAGADVQGA
jgi:CRISPR-associated protein Csb1